MIVFSAPSVERRNSFLLFQPTRDQPQDDTQVPVPEL